jgi:ribose/xylose/arabinose/galactoside ABC-type transport system permease subunit
MSIGEDNQHGTKESGFKLFNKFDLSIRSIIALMLCGTVCAMAVLEIKVEEPLYSAVLMALGLYFGTKKTS